MSLAFAEEGGSATRAELVLTFQQKPHWHIYWLNPGDSGEEARVEALTKGLEFGALEFPIPTRIPTGPLTNFGYEEPTVTMRLPVQRLPADVAVIDVGLTYLICERECVPEEAQFRLRVPPASVGGTVTSMRLAGFPVRTGIGSRGEPARGRFRYDGGDAVFEIPNGTSAGGTPGVEFFPLTTPLLVAGDAGRLESNILRVALESMVLSDASFQRPKVVEGLLVEQAGEGGARVAKWVRFELETPFDLIGLLKSLGFAFLGGLILNLMPCVFPVVSLKVLSFVKEGGGGAAAHGESAGSGVRKHAYAYTAGIVLSLWALVAVLLLVRAAGSAVGWGFQLQSPVFLFVLLGVFFVLSLNLLGVFEINYSGPGALQNLMMRRGLSGSFFTGLLTTVVATPCSAPFMGVAIGHALAAGAFEAFAVFTSLALGLAAPYLILGLNPKWMRFLPKPGAWMERLKEILAFPLLLTAVWLFWVLSQLVDVGALVPVLAWCVAAGFVAWSLSDKVRVMKSMRWVKWLALVLFALCTFVSVTALQAGNFAQSARDTGNAGTVAEMWKPYTEAALQRALSEGRSVFIDFTASWCVTCQVNKRLVLSTQAASELFEREKIVLFRADWTKRDSEISNALAKLGRNSVPVYAFYRKGQTPPVLLPEILTMDILRNAVQEASPNM
ncbi:MAG: thioredoxin family protein [Bdellovibrionales bacterium]|nr:thioredoxin family protein [Bdellovibrionales bacterium]